MTFSPSKHWTPPYKCVRGIKLPEDEEQSNVNDTLSAPSMTSEHTLGSWRACVGYLCKIHMTNDACLPKNILELINSTVVIHKILIWNNNPVGINTRLDELESDEFSNMEDVKHTPDKEALFPKTPTQEHGTDNSRCTFKIYFSVSIVELQVPALVTFLTKIPRVRLVFDASFLDTCNGFNYLNMIYLH